MAYKYEQLVQEDLNVGVEATWVTAPGSGELRSIQIGLHSVARGQKKWTCTWAPGAITTTSKASTTIAVTDAAVEDFVMASHDKILTNDLQIAGHVSEAGTVTVVIHNPTSATITVASGTLSVLVFPAKTGAAPTTMGIITGTIYWDAEVGGNELAGATVTIAALGLSTTSAANGTYTLTGVTPGDVTVAADANNPIYQDGSTDGTALAGQTVTINVVCPGI